MIDGCMMRHVISVSPSTTAQEAARLVVAHHIGTLPVVDQSGILVGVVRLDDLLELFMPDFVHLLDDIDFVHDFGALEAISSLEIAAATQRTMRDLMRPPTAVEHTSGLLRAYAVMVKHDIRDLPIVDGEGRLVGIASRVDIGAAYLAPWTQTEQLT